MYYNSQLVQFGHVCRKVQTDACSVIRLTGMDLVYNFSVAAKLILPIVYFVYLLNFGLAEGEGYYQN